MTTRETETGLELRRVVDARPERVWAAWTEPARMRRWLCPDMATLEEVEADVRPGGGYRLHMRGAEGETYTASGVYRTVEAPSRLVFTWDWEEEDHAVGETVVTVVLREVEEGTEVVLTHEGFPAAEAVEGHRQGWTSILGRLEGAV